MRWDIRVYPPLPRQVPLLLHSPEGALGREDVVPGAFFTILGGADIVCWGEHRQTGIVVIGSGHAKPSITENGWMGERFHTLDIKQSNKDSVDPCSSLCAAQPATRRKDRCGDALTL